MMAEVSRSWLEAAGATLIIAVAALLVLLAGLAVAIILPATLVIVLMGYPGAASPTSGIGGWLLLLWFPAAFAGAIYTVATGLEVMGEPSLGGLLKLMGVTALIFFTFPPFLFPAP